MMRYGLSFTLKKGRLSCDHPSYRGYYIDLNASEEDKLGFPFSLLIKHEEEELPSKLILADASVIKNERVKKERHLAPLNKLWMLGKMLFGKGPQSDELLEEVTIKGPQHTEDKTLKHHAIYRSALYRRAHPRRSQKQGARLYLFAQPSVAAG